MSTTLITADQLYRKVEITSFPPSSGPPWQTT